MKHYIDKDALVAEIERRMQELHPTNTHQMQVGEKMDRDVLMWLNALTWVKNFIDTLEVKEVDLDKEIESYFKGFGKFPSVGIADCIDIAKHFFELGLKAHKEEQYDKQRENSKTQEDDNHIIGITQTIGGAIKHNVISHKTGNMQISWLKSIRHQNNITDEELAQAKKDAYNDVLDKIEYHSEEPTFDDGWSAAIWYLKKRNAQPQATWKPSDEQMEALLKLEEMHVLEHEKNQENAHLYIVIKSLREQLNKLMKE